MSNEYDGNEPENEIPPVIRGLLAAIEGRQATNKAFLDHRERIELQAQKIAQRLRLSVYAETDKIDGPSESEAFGALRQWRKAVDKLGPIIRRTPDAHKAAVAQAIVDMVRLYESETCPCPQCKAEREGTAS